MKKILSLIIALAMILSLTAFAFAENATVQVSGSGKVNVKADTASVTIGVRTSNKDVASAHERNVELIKTVMAALEKLGIAKEDMSTIDYNVYNSYSPTGEENYYEVSNNLSVVVCDLEKISKVIDAATKAGANQIYGISFSDSKGRDAYDKALELAVEDAMKKAEVLAKASGKKLGNLVSVTEQGNYWRTSSGAKLAMDSMNMGAENFIDVGDVTISAEVSIVFELE